MLLFERVTREGYQYQEQPTSATWTAISSTLRRSSLGTWLAIYDTTFATGELDEAQQSRKKELYCRHYHYVKNTEQDNNLHYATLMDPMACSATASLTTIVGCEPEGWVPAGRYEGA